MGSINQLPSQYQILISNLLDNKEVDPASFIKLSEYTKDEFFRNNPNFITSNWNWGTTQINNKDVDGNLLPLQDSRALIDEIIDGNRLIVNLGTRKAGTRVGIHVHQSGGTTFVVGGEGAITDYVEGYENSYNPVGNYYYMPYNTPMSAANLEEQDVVLLDLFYFPAEGQSITIIEEGYPTYDPPQYFYDAIFVAPEASKQTITDKDIDRQNKQFEVLGNITNTRSTQIRFDEIQNQNPVNLERTTAGGGTIQSNAPSAKQNEASIGGIYFDRGIIQPMPPLAKQNDASIDGVYFNSAAGDDEITGSKFNDFIRGGDGEDVIAALEGNDIIRGGGGGDLMHGGSGADIFYYTFNQIDNSTDQIKDFNQSEGDKIYIESGIKAFASGCFIILEYGDSETHIDIGSNWNSIDTIVIETLTA